MLFCNKGEMTMTQTHNFRPMISDEDLFRKIELEREQIGYYALPFQDTAPIKEYAQSVHQKHIAIVGIGGSTLGTYAVYSFLRDATEFSKTLHFFESTDPLDIAVRLKFIDLKNTLFIVISKSGTTVETLSIFKYLHSVVTIDRENCVIITEADSQLNDYARSENMRTFEIPKNVGGRFSVFSAVGLVPLAIVGVDIDALLQAARDVHDSFFSKQECYRDLMRKARFLVENKKEYNINVLFSYSTMLEGFNKWYVQLWGESLGKVDTTGTKQGLTPIGLIGPVDQHSFLQLIMEGVRDKTVTFIIVDDFLRVTRIPDITLTGLETADNVNTITFSELIQMQAHATIEALKALKDIPYDVITVTEVDEANIARLIYSYELLTSLCAGFMGIDAYNQPGVEAGKIILKKKLKT